MDAPQMRSSLPPASPPARVSSRTLLWLSIAAVVVIAAVGAAVYFKGAPAQDPPPTAASSQEFVIHHGINDYWYTLVGGEVQARLAPQAAAAIHFSFPIIEAGPALSSGAYPVLTRLPKTSGTVFGLVAPSGAFTPIVSDGTYKEGLVVKNGTAAFASFIPAKGIPTIGAIAQQVLGMDTASGKWNITAVNLGGPKYSPQAVGQGYDPHFLPDGRILALSATGVVAIDMRTSKSVTLLVAPGILPGGYAVSKDLSRVAITDLKGTANVYSLNTADALTLLGALPTRLFPLSFLPDGNLIGFSSQTASTMDVYDVTSAPVLVQTATISSAKP